jgi:hypothetical protein
MVLLFQAPLEESENFMGASRALIWVPPYGFVPKCAMSAHFSVENPTKFQTGER